MTYFEQFKAPKIEARDLRDLNPLQAYTFYERTVLLDSLLQKMDPGERVKFENVFTSLKSWNAQGSASAARDYLLNNVQHCILLGMSVA